MHYNHASDRVEYVSTATGLTVDTREMMPDDRQLDVLQGAKKMSKERRELTAAQSVLTETILTQLFPCGESCLGTHPEELADASTSLLVASQLCRRAAEVHQGLLVSWRQMCDAASVSPVASRLKGSQDVLEPLLRQLGIELVRQDNWRKGAALPGFSVASGAALVAGENKESPAPECELEDLTTLSCEPERNEETETTWYIGSE